QRRIYSAFPPAAGQRLLVEYSRFCPAQHRRPVRPPATAGQYRHHAAAADSVHPAQPAATATTPARPELTQPDRCPLATNPLYSPVLYYARSALPVNHGETA